MTPKFCKACGAEIRRLNRRANYCNGQCRQDFFTKPAAPRETPPRMPTVQEVLDACARRAVVRTVSVIDAASPAFRELERAQLSEFLFGHDFDAMEPTI